MVAVQVNPQADGTCGGYCISVSPTRAEVKKDLTVVGMGSSAWRSGATTDLQTVGGGAGGGGHVSTTGLQRTKQGFCRMHSAAQVGRHPLAARRASCLPTRHAMPCLATVTFVQVGVKVMDSTDCYNGEWVCTRLGGITSRLLLWISEGQLSLPGLHGCMPSCSGCAVH